MLKVMWLLMKLSYFDSTWAKHALSNLNGNSGSQNLRLNR